MHTAIGAMMDSRVHWSIDDIPFAAIDHARATVDPFFFYILASASFVEITSDLYTHNLVELFREDDEVVRWLRNCWEPEELQHGHALRHYVKTVWPDFPWHQAYGNFYGEYSRLCRVDLLAPTLALELVARCLVETGTATLYRTIAASTSEPVLRQLANHIATDEVRHYKYFYKFFRRVREREGIGRLAVAQTLWRKHAEIRYDDVRLAFKHSFEARNAGRRATTADFDLHWRHMLALMRDQYPFDMAVRMILKPLDLRPSIGRVALPLASAAARGALLVLAH